MKRLIAISAIISAVLNSCIQNDVPLPYEEIKITKIEAEGCLKAEIFDDRYAVVLDMAETCNLSEVKITKVELNYDGATSSVQLEGNVFDLRVPLTVVFEKYGRQFSWTISATQTISRSIIFQNQVGATFIDPVNCRATMKIAKSVPLTHLTVKEFKLGPEGQTTYDPDPATLHNFIDVVKVRVRYRDVDELWSIRAESSMMSVEFNAISPRSRRCWLSANAPDGAANGFRYRAAGQTEWKEITEVSAAQGVISACADSLQPYSTYECVAFSGTEETPIETFTTEDEIAIPNGGFETTGMSGSGSYKVFWNANDKDPACRSEWWGSGNGSEKASGSADMGFIICDSDESEFHSGARSAQLLSQWAIVKFAAGNLFSGEFAGLVGTSGGKVNFGRPFTRRPASLHLWFRYDCGTIDHVSEYPTGDPVKEGDPDRGQIYIALGDWDYKTYGGTADCPVQVNTMDKTTLFKPEGPNVIAYGSFLTTKSTDGWQELDIPLEYRDNFRAPTHIIISCASSALGDYFTGSSKSRMWVDDVQLRY